MISADDWDVILVTSSPALRLAARVDRATHGCATPDDDDAYEHGAYVPGGGWRPLSAADHRRLAPTTGARPAIHQTVALLRFPDDLGTQIRTRAAPHVGDTLPRADLRFVLHAIDTLCAFDRAILFHGVADHEPRRPTSTINQRTGLRPGLHLDDWEGSDLARRGDRLNRLSINLGSAPRYFLFVPISAAAMRRSLPADRLDSESSSHDLTRAFLSCFADVPIFRLRIEPGEAYVAPTENILHDGLSDAAAADRHMTFRGRFACRTA